MQFSLEPRISWGDVLMTTGLVISGVIAFGQVSEGVTLNASAIEVIDGDIRQLAQDHRNRLQLERADRERMRLEMREDLRAISEKLDRIIESKLLESEGT
ncbi:MAG TPA: hypothetical protein DCP57_04335 [Gammaproteobacteria bacterium]|nr:hypothetical protein [Gammaproteobacteria bacterium]|tara:strand:+ start:217 stop:516 length:300 start_codon:yes stop_codon:yes gene_type:complete